MGGEKRAYIRSVACALSRGGRRVSTPKREVSRLSKVKEVALFLRNRAMIIIAGSKWNRVEGETGVNEE